MSDSFAAPDGRRLAYRDSRGDGPPVLCLSGLTRNADDFEDLARHLGGRYRMIRLDSRGRGDSEWAKDAVAEYQVPVEARDALALLDHLGIQRTALIGTSRGGILGMAIAAMAPGRLNCLVMNDVGPVVERSGLERILAYVGLDPGWADFSEAATGLAQSMGAAFPDLTGEQWMAFARSIYADEDGRPALTYDPRLRDAVTAGGTEPVDLWPLFEGLGALPVLVIRGENSDVLSAETLAEMLRRRPATRAVTIPHRGHVPFLDEPEAREAIDDFLAAHAAEVVGPVPGEAIGIADIRAAAQRLAGRAVTTPMLESEFLNRLAGRRVLVKAECLQRTGSFKFRGGWSALTALSEAARRQGVIAYSSGNHAQGVAEAARLLGAPAVIVMPADAPALKRDNTRALGAEVVLYDRAGGESREATGEALAEERGLTLIRPYDEPMVMAGQGTTGLEIAAQARAAGVEQADVLVCCGGGGLASGIALALEAEAPGLRVRPVEPEGWDDTARSLAAGRRLPADPAPASICDAIMTPMPGALTFPILARLAGPGIAVSDTEALRAVALAMLRLKIVAEPGGAVALAAAVFRPGAVEGEAVICLVTGGNADPAMLSRALATLGD